MHSIQHAPNDIARWGDTDNMDVEAAELAHKNWIKQQGGKTNQGPAVQKSMMIHTLRKEASALCCEAVQGDSGGKGADSASLDDSVFQIRPNPERRAVVTGQGGSSWP